MKNLFSSFKGEDKTVKKLKTEIENTEFKKQSLIAPLRAFTKI
jgi:hypothetical protein